MKKVGIDYTRASARAMRRLAFLVSIFAAPYTVFAVLDLVPRSPLLTPLFACVFALCWFFAAAYYFFFPSHTGVERYVRIVMYHMVGVASLVFVTGFATPLVALYVLLLIASHTFFGRRGLFLSIVTLLLVALADAWIERMMGHVVLVDNIVAFTATVTLGLALVGFMSTQETRRKTLIHSRQRAKLQQERLTTIINNLNDATFSVSESGVISLYNAACLGLLDLNINLKGKNIAEVLQLIDTDGGKVSVPDLLKEATKTVTRDDLLHQYDDGETIRLELTYAPIRSNYSASKRKEEQGGYIVIMRDVTKQKSLEEERDEFISVVSHELRTPITIAEGTISNLEVLMERGFDTVEPALLEKTVSTAHEQVMYLARMVNDLSTLSRAERGVAADPEEIDVKQLMQGLYQKYQPEAAERNLSLDLDLGTKLGVVSVSKLYLEELLQNFITNAIKYTNEGHVAIIAKRHGSNITFSVRDTGIGMSRADQTKVFQKFYRSEDYRIRETSGTGLGLYVSAKLAHMLGTKIELQSRVNFGSTFSFTLPAKKETTNK